VCVCFVAARPSDTEMPGLCSDAELRRNEWPWIGESVGPAVRPIFEPLTMLAVCTPSISRQRPPPGISRAGDNRLTASRRQ